MMEIQKNTNRALLRERENKIYQASTIGDVASLKELMEEDNLALARLSVTCFDETPLHISAMQGHADAVTFLLSHKPNMAAELNWKGQTPLHLAATNGYIDILKQLIAAESCARNRNNKVWTIRDEDGRTPLHLAVMKGHGEAVKELIQANPCLHQYTSLKGETLLHCAVKNNRLEALKIMMEFGVDDQNDSILNSRYKDDHDNTVLHIATYMKQVETVQYLLNWNELRVNAVNRHKLTAFDIAEQAPTDLKSFQIRESLLKAGASRYDNLSESESSKNLGPPPGLDHRKKKRIPKTNNHKAILFNFNQIESLMITATVIATMAYQGILSPPGGYWDDEGATKHSVAAGTSILAYKEGIYFARYKICNTVSFIASLTIIFLLISGLRLEKRIFMWILRIAMMLAITTMAFTYLLSLEAISSSHQYNEAVPPVVKSQKDAHQDSTPMISTVVVLVWVGLTSIVFFGNIFRFVQWASRKAGGCMRRSQNSGKREDV